MIYIILVLAILAAYEPVRHNGFVDYDDDQYVTENPHVNEGLSGESVLWAFTSFHFGMWHPLTSLSHIVNYELFGPNASGHHLTDLLLHIASTLLLFCILKKMTGAVWPSAFVAAVFALHPLNVESVVWVSERKNTLSTFFWMLTIASYIWYAQRPAITRYVVVVFVFCLGVMSKPVVVTLPFVLLLLDYWPLRRLQLPGANAPPQSDSPQTNFQSASLLRLVAEKIPLLILVLVLCVITLLAQQTVNAMITLEESPFGVRIANALVSYTNYIAKMLYPVRLTVAYLPQKLSLWQMIVSFIVLAVISTRVIYEARRRRWLLVGWLWYLGTLAPMIGIVQAGPHAMADRATYIPLIGIYIITAWGAAEFSTRWRHRKIGLSITAGVILMVLLTCSRKQVRHWQNSFALYGHGIAVTENNYLMHNNYGSLLLNEHELDKAIAHFNEAVRIKPDFADGHYNLGLAFSGKGNIELTIANYTKALTYNPDMLNANCNLGNIYLNLNKTDEAIACYSRALKIEPDFPGLNFNMGLALASQGKYGKAIEYFNEVLRVDHLNQITGIRNQSVGYPRGNG